MLNLASPIVLMPGQSIGVQINCPDEGPDYYNGPCPTMSDGNLAITGSFSSTALSGGGTFSPRCFAGSVIYSPSSGDFVVQTAGQESGTEFGIGSTTQIFTATDDACLLYTSPSPRDRQKSRMPSSA